MKGKKQPFTLPFTLDIVDGIATMNGTVELDRTLWNVGTGNRATDEWVSTKVSVNVTVVASNPL